MLADGYSDSPVEPISFYDNKVSNENGMKMIEQNPSDCQYDFSRGNYFFGTNLGWEDDDIPDGLIWEQEPQDLGTTGRDLLERIKCNAGPTWEQYC